MNTSNSPRQSLIPLPAVALWPGIAAAQGDAVADSLNAHVKRYGCGWESERVDRVIEDACAVVTVPSNAFLDSRGEDWECDPELPEERSVVHDTGNTGERLHRFLRKQSGVQVGLSAARRKLYFERRLEHPIEERV